MPEYLNAFSDMSSAHIVRVCSKMDGSNAEKYTHSHTSEERLNKNASAHGLASH